MSEHSVVLVSCPPNEAEALAGRIVEERLAACVTIVPGARSVYRWEGKIRREEESLLVIKTASARVAALTERVRALHSYACPEVIALPVEAGSTAYLSWLSAETAPG